MDSSRAGTPKTNYGNRLLMSKQTTESTTDEQVPEDADTEDIETDHLDSVEDGCGCAEVWEHLSEERDGETSADD
jgi:hypothetical protein